MISQPHGTGDAGHPRGHAPSQEDMPRTDHAGQGRMLAGDELRQKHSIHEDPKGSMDTVITSIFKVCRRGREVS